MKVWKIAPGENAKLWKDCKDGGYICIGWEHLGNLKNYKKQKYIEDALGPNKKGGKQSNNAGSLWSFCNEISIGDLVFANDGKTKLKGVGVIVSDYISPDSDKNPRFGEDYSNVRKVFWLWELSGELEGKPFDMKTVTPLDDGDKRINEILEQNNTSISEIIELRNEKMLSMKIEEKTKLLEYQRQIILQGPPGTGKTRLAKQMARYIIQGDSEPRIDDMKGQVKLIQFHPSYSYEDFVRGIVAKSDGKSIEYITENKVLAQMAKEAKESLDSDGESAKKYILIIDEINRANLSSVLGELIYALEYRDEAVESMYEIGNSREITLPSNLYIIGTMNTADRSIGHIDYAIRRRFTFVDVLPEEDVASDKILFNSVKALFVDDKGNRADTLSMEFNPYDVMLGHSYFIGSETALVNKLEYQVKPLLLEYIKDGVLNESAKDNINALSVTSNDQ